MTDQLEQPQGNDEVQVLVARYHMARRLIGDLAVEKAALVEQAELLVQQNRDLIGRVAELERFIVSLQTDETSIRSRQTTEAPVAELSATGLATQNGKKKKGQT